MLVAMHGGLTSRRYFSSNYTMVDFKCKKFVKESLERGGICI